MKLFTQKMQVTKDTFEKKLMQKYTVFSNTEQEYISMIHKKDITIFSYMQMILELLYQMKSMQQTNGCVLQNTIIKQQIQSILHATIVFPEITFLKEMLYQNKKWDSVFLEKAIYEIENNIKKNNKNDMIQNNSFVDLLWQNFKKYEIKSLYDKKNKHIQKQFKSKNIFIKYNSILKSIDTFLKKKDTENGSNLILESDFKKSLYFLGKYRLNEEIILLYEYQKINQYKYRIDSFLKKQKNVLHDFYKNSTQKEYKNNTYSRLFLKKEYEKTNRINSLFQEKFVEYSILKNNFWAKIKRYNTKKEHILFFSFYDELKKENIFLDIIKNKNFLKIEGNNGEILQKYVNQHRKIQNQYYFEKLKNIVKYSVFDIYYKNNQFIILKNNVEKNRKELSKDFLMNQKMVFQHNIKRENEILLKNRLEQKKINILYHDLKTYYLLYKQKTNCFKNKFFFKNIIKEIKRNQFEFLFNKNEFKIFLNKYREEKIYDLFLRIKHSKKVVLNKYFIEQNMQQYLDIEREKRKQIFQKSVWLEQEVYKKKNSQIKENYVNKLILDIKEKYALKRVLNKYAIEQNMQQYLDIEEEKRRQIFQKSVWLEQEVYKKKNSQIKENYVNKLILDIKEKYALKRVLNKYAIEQNMQQYLDIEEEKRRQIFQKSVWLEQEVYKKKNSQIKENYVNKLILDIKEKYALERILNKYGIEQNMQNFLKFAIKEKKQYRKKIKNKYKKIYMEYEYKFQSKNILKNEYLWHDCKEVVLKAFKTMKNFEYFINKTSIITQQPNYIINEIKNRQPIDQNESIIEKKLPQKNFSLVNRKEKPEKPTIHKNMAKEDLLQNQALYQQIQQMIQKEIQIYCKEQVQESETLLQGKIDALHKQQKYWQEQFQTDAIYQQIYQKLERTLRHEKRQWGI